MQLPALLPPLARYRGHPFKNPGFLSFLLFAIFVRALFQVLAFIPFAFEFESED